ncbi:HrpT family type III secretion system protein [[Erwinia] mediterraneensis]|uniref:HrpT family type III secretion system protein n=1 Tax=[Erwinia] mediterraneensis TaxID=2161819 RepID=UPI00102FFC97|nr:HrpT family type III secretion system protein [[Erwinia] mediterraneensis]
MKSRLLVFLLLVLTLSGCAGQMRGGCQDVSCRPLSDYKKLTIWWPEDMRNSDDDYTRVAMY